MASSSGTTVATRDEVIEVARATLIANLEHLGRHNEWPTLTQMAHRDSWRGGYLRKESRDHLIAEDYLKVQDDRRAEVTTKGEEWVKAPNFVSQAEPEWKGLPGEVDEFDVVDYVEKFYDRHQRWPHLQHIKGSGVRTRVGVDGFNDAFKNVIDSGFLKLISVRNRTHTETLIVSLRYVPWLRGAYSLYWWPPSAGPLRT